MKLVWSEDAWQDYLWWQREDRTLLRRINQLVQDIERTSHDGLGKPEPLKHALQGYWSRRINVEHRLVYKLVGDEIRIAGCGYHYAP